jgi:drug/metabolite transporter (DMT)-like permease
MSFEWMAIAAATCWAIGSLLSAQASSHLGAFAFTRWRMAAAATLLWGMAFYTGQWRSLPLDSYGLLMLSGLIGILIGDTALFASMNRLGPRRTGVLFATHALFSALLAWWFFGESLWGWTLVGASLLSSGVMTAIFFGKRQEEQHAWENNQHQFGIGVALGLLAALCQAVSTLMLKPLMVSGVDAISASAVRMSTALVCHLALLWCGFAVARCAQPMTAKVLGMVVLNALLSMVIGMTLILQALKTGDAGLVAMLSSISPVVVLPLLWLVYRRRPALGAWLGASMTVVGTVLILAH